MSRRSKGCRQRGRRGSKETAEADTLVVDTTHHCTPCTTFGPTLLDPFKKSTRYSSFVTYSHRADHL